MHDGAAVVQQGHEHALRKRGCGFGSPGRESECRGHRGRDEAVFEANGEAVEGADGLAGALEMGVEVAGAGDGGVDQEGGEAIR